MYLILMQLTESTTFTGNFVRTGGCLVMISHSTTPKEKESTFGLH